MRARVSHRRLQSRIVAVSAAAIALAGCGDEEESGDGAPATTSAQETKLTAQEAGLIPEAAQEVGAYCAKVAALVGAGGGPPPTADYERVTGALDALAELAREKPEATGPGGFSAPLALGDLAENLEGSNCDSRLNRRIDEALAESP